MSTLVEKYRPRTWDQVYGNEWIKNTLQRILDNGTEQHMLFVGPPGSGKTTIARIFASKYLEADVDFSVDHPDYREMNASDERGIDVVRGRKIKKYCETRGQNGKKRILFLDEGDGFTLDAQRALRAIMENNQDKVIIILSLNHINKIKETALLSRCMVFKFDPQPPEIMSDYLKKILYGEGIVLRDNDIIKDIVNFPEYSGDFRRMINDTVQKLVGIKHDVTKEDLPWIYNESYYDLIDNILKEPKKSITIYFSEYRKRYIDPVIFISQLFKKIRKTGHKLSFSLTKTFAEVEYRLKTGADDLIQMYYLLTVLGVEFDESTNN